VKKKMLKFAADHADAIQIGLHTQNGLNDALKETLARHCVAVEWHHLIQRPPAVFERGADATSGDSAPWDGAI
jgi:hypothetical protein